jgi:hypothetical protein
MWYNTSAERRACAMKEQRYSDHEIIYMQVRLYHLACEKWDATPKEILAIFKKSNLFLKIKECYDSFHLYSDEGVLEDLFQMIEGDKPKWKTK